MILLRGTVTIARESCKGCELCIPACRPGVLVMSTDLNEIGYRYPELLAGCTGCRACHAVCPDFVFDVYKFDTPIVMSSFGLSGDDDALDDAHDDEGDIQ